MLKKDIHKTIASIDTSLYLSSKIEVIYLKDILRMGIHPYKDMRSFMSYCKRQNIEIFGSQKSRYVFALQIKRAVLQERINHLNAKYGSGWTEVLKAEMNLCSQLQSALAEIENNRSNSQPKPKSKTRTETERRFLIDCEKLLS